jgi:hypothetical protein
MHSKLEYKFKMVNLYLGIMPTAMHSKVEYKFKMVNLYLDACLFPQILVLVRWQICSRNSPGIGLRIGLRIFLMIKLAYSQSGTTMFSCKPTVGEIIMPALYCSSFVLFVVLSATCLFYPPFQHSHYAILTTF